MNESLAKYLAGLLDADGSLSFNFKRDQNRMDRHFVGLMLKLSSSDAVDFTGFVDKLPEETGFGSVYKEGRNQQFKNWTITKRADLEMFLPRVIKHMVVKARHWQWMLDIWRDLRRSSVSTDEMDEMKLASKASRVERTGPIKPKNHPTWAWLAGYIDGDGCYTKRYDKGQNYWTIHISAVAHENDRVGIDFIHSAFGGNFHPQGQSSNVTIWRRNLGARDAQFALRLLPNLAKHSRLKRHKINEIIHHHRQRLNLQGAAA